MSEKEELRRLKKENRRLRRENAYLREQIFPDRGDTQTERNFSARARKSAALHGRTYFGYLLETFRRSRVFMIYDRTRFAFRGFFLAGKLWHFFILLGTALGIGAQFLLMIGALAVFIPAAVLVSLTIGIYGYWVYKKQNRFFASFFEGYQKERVYLFFEDGEKKRGYFEKWIASLIRQGDVFIVSESLRKTGISGVRKRKDGVYLVHIGYYFYFVRILPQDRVVKIY